MFEFVLITALITIVRNTVADNTTTISFPTVLPLNCTCPSSNLMYSTMSSSMNSTMPTALLNSTISLKDYNMSTICNCTNSSNTPIQGGGFSSNSPLKINGSSSNPPIQGGSGSSSNPPIQGGSGSSSNPPIQGGSGSTTNPFLSFAPQVQQVLKQFFPALSSNLISTFVTNQSLLFKQIDSVTSTQWKTDATMAYQWSKYMETLLLKGLSFGDVTVERLRNLFPFRQDCNLAPLIDAWNLSSSEKQALIDYALKYLPSQISTTMCSSIAPAPAPNVNNIQNSINSGFPIGALYSQQSLNQLGSGDKLSVLSVLGNSSSSNVDKNTAISLGKSLPPNTNFTQCLAVASSVPITIINNAPPQDIINNIAKMDVSNMDPSRIGFIASKIVSNLSVSQMNSILSSGQSSIIQAISYKTFLSLNVSTSSLAPSSLPRAFNLNKANTLLSSTSIDKITDTNTLIQAAQALTPSALKNVPSSSIITTAINLLTASNSYNSTGSLTKTQKSALLQSILNYLQIKSGSSLPSVYLDSLSSSDATNLTELFIEANETILSAAASKSWFSNVVSAASSFSSSKCSSFLKMSAKIFTKYAVDQLKNNGGTTLTSSNLLDSLGVCFANNINDTELSSISSNDIVSKIQYFIGSQFQPNQATSEIFTQKLDTYIKNITTQSAKEDLIFNTLQDSALFLSNISSIVSNTTMKTKGSALITQAISSKDTTSSSIQQQRLGVGNDSYINAKLESLKKAYRDSLLGSGSSTSSTNGKRRKREVSSSSPLTCNSLYSLSSASSLSSVTANDLSTLNKTEFTNCMALYSTYSWSIMQAAQLVSLMKQSYSDSVSLIPDSDLAYFSTFLIGLTSNELASLNISSLNTINALGLVNTWTNTQMTSLVTAIKKNGLNVSSSSVLTQMKNLACGIPSNDWSSMSSSIVSEAQSTLKTISNSDCPTISNMFSLLKPSSFDSASLTDLDIISGGFSAQDLSSSAISTDILPFANLKYTSANTINSMNTTYLNVLTTAQITALVNSPYYSNFSSSIKTSLNSLSSGISAVDTSPTGSSSASKLITTRSLSQISLIAIITFCHSIGRF